MSDTIHTLVEQYGLLAVFLGCIAEGETAAILAGFFAHQHVFVPAQAFAAAYLGAFLGDTMFFLIGSRFSALPWVATITSKPGFATAQRMIREHPDLYVLGNRFVYGFRLIGGVAAGLSGIPMPRFLLLNALSAALWATLFVGVGYVFGLSAEAVVGSELQKHERLLIGLAIAIAVAAIAGYIAHRRARMRSGLAT